MANHSIAQTTLRNTSRGLTGLILGGFLWATPACADDGWDKFDGNGDGRITFEEVMRHIEPSVRKSFDSLDRNGDGVLSRSDFDDVRDSIKKFEDWLDEFLDIFIPSEEDEEQWV
ncbi:MAG: hypothetical protein ACE5F3_08440 [Mariprofundaceae bacterium]